MYGGVQHILYCVFCFVCLRLVSSFSGLSMFDCPFGFSNVFIQWVKCCSIFNLAFCEQLFDVVILLLAIALSIKT